MANKKTTNSSWEGLGANTAIVFDYLMTGKEISQLIAFNNLAVASLTSRISQIKVWLKKQGELFEGKVLSVGSEWRKDYGGKRYKSYWLEGLPTPDAEVTPPKQD